jgi:hypothetical protein
MLGVVMVLALPLGGAAALPQHPATSALAGLTV